jgi:hypothetical protein
LAGKRAISVGDQTTRSINAPRSMVLGRNHSFERERDDSGSRVTGAGGRTLIGSMTAGRSAISIGEQTQIVKARKR